MIAIEETATVQPDGRLVLERPEFKPGGRIKVIMLLEDAATPDQQLPPAPAGRKLKGDWGGTLADLGRQYTSVELQHKANEWRGG